jgi:hypothetical protein
MFSLLGRLTFDARGDRGASFILISPGSISVAGLGSMALEGGAQASRIIWVIRGGASFARLE